MKGAIIGWRQAKARQVATRELGRGRRAPLIPGRPRRRQEKAGSG
jgi:hypothetical protein